MGYTTKICKFQEVKYMMDFGNLWSRYLCGACEYV